MNNNYCCNTFKYVMMQKPIGQKDFIIKGIRYEDRIIFYCPFCGAKLIK